MSGNREITDEQFSAGTTIDSSRIDNAVDDAMQHINNIEQIEGRWTPTNYVAHWSPARAFDRMRSEPNANGILNNRTRIHPLIHAGNFEHTLPFMPCRNWNDEYYPRIRSTTPNTETHNEWRHKGFALNVVDIEQENWCRGSDAGYAPVSTTPADSGAGTSYTDAALDLSLANPNTYQSYALYTGGAAPAVSTQIHPMSNKYHAVTFSYYFAEPVILSAVSVVAAQEHPISYHASGVGAGPTYYGLPAGSVGFKDAPLQATPYDDNAVKGTIAAKHIELTTDADFNLNETGAEYWGAYSQACGGAPLSLRGKNPHLSAQILIDNDFNTENRHLNDIAFQVFSRDSANGNSDDWFNKVFPTSNRGAVGTAGATYTNFTPEYPGGSTWGVFIDKKDLNIPIPRNSRVRFSIIVRGWLTTQGFEWNSNLTVLEQTET